MTLDVDVKNILDDLTNKFLEIFNITIIADSVNKELTKSYDKGLENAEISFDMNFSRNNRRLDFLKKYSFDNIKGLNEDAADKLRSELQRAMLNLESVEQMKKRVQKVIDTSVDRARAIARTELNRAENMGHLDGARQSGLVLKKRWDAHLDNRTSPVCRALDGKTIPLNAKFKWEGQEFDAPPAHVQCRSTLLFIQEDEK